MADSFRNPLADIITGNEVHSSRVVICRKPSIESLVPTERMLKARGELELALTRSGAKTKNDFTITPFVDQQLTAMNGWLCTRGILYPCLYGGHDGLCIALDRALGLGYSREDEMENRGWCKLTSLRWLTGKRFMPMPLTREQLATIREWYLKNSFDLAHYRHLPGVEDGLSNSITNV